MITREGASLKISGPVLYSNVTTLLLEGNPHLDTSLSSIDLGGITEADSTALALLFAWLRRIPGISQNPSSIKIINPPPGLLSLATLYGVADHLPLTPQA